MSMIDKFTREVYTHTQNFLISKGGAVSSTKVITNKDTNTQFALNFTLFKPEDKFDTISAPLYLEVDYNDNSYEMKSINKLDKVPKSSEEETKYNVNGVEFSFSELADFLSKQVYNYNEDFLCAEIMQKARDYIFAALPTHFNVLNLLKLIQDKENTNTLAMHRNMISGSFYITYNPSFIVSSVRDQLAHSIIANRIPPGDPLPQEDVVCSLVSFYLCHEIEHMIRGNLGVGSDGLLAETGDKVDGQFSNIVMDTLINTGLTGAFNRIVPELGTPQVGLFYKVHFSLIPNQSITSLSEDIDKQLDYIERIIKNNAQIIKVNDVDLSASTFRSQMKSAFAQGYRLASFDVDLDNPLDKSAAKAYLFDSEIAVYMQPSFMGAFANNSNEMTTNMWKFLKAFSSTLSVRNENSTKIEPPKEKQPPQQPPDEEEDNNQPPQPPDPTLLGYQDILEQLINSGIPKVKAKAILDGYINAKIKVILNDNSENN